MCLCGGVPENWLKSVQPQADAQQDKKVQQVPVGPSGGSDRTQEPQTIAAG